MLSIIDKTPNRTKKGRNLDTVDFTNKRIRIQTPHSKMVLEELGLEENKLYKISKKEYLTNHPELNQEKQEIIDKRYDHYEERRQEAIQQAREIRSKILKEEEQGDGSNPNRTSKYSSKGFNTHKTEENNQAMQSGMIKKELEKLEMIKKQQLGEIKNLIDYEYGLNETRKKNEQKEINEPKEWPNKIIFFPGKSFLRFSIISSRSSTVRSKPFFSARRPILPLLFFWAFAPVCPCPLISCAFKT